MLKRVILGSIIPDTQEKEAEVPRPAWTTNCNFVSQTSKTIGRLCIWFENLLQSSRIQATWCCCRLDTGQRRRIKSSEMQHLHVVTKTMQQLEGRRNPVLWNRHGFLAKLVPQTPKNHVTWIDSQLESECALQDISKWKRGSTLKWFQLLGKLRQETCWNPGV